MTRDGMGKGKGDCSWNFWLEKLSRWQVRLTEPGRSGGAPVGGAGGSRESDSSFVPVWFASKLFK